MRAKQVSDYIVNTLEQEPRHNCGALAKAITKASKKFDQDQFDMMYLLLENKPIGGHTHSYGFHTAYGRELIETMSNYYYQFNQALCLK
jgi:hypothetical protein